MELKKEDIQRLRTKSKAASQITFDMDYNVPDIKPDIGRMIQNKGDITVEEVHLTDGHAFLKGKLQADILYVGDEDGKVYSLSANLPMEETLNLDGIVNGDKMCLKWEIEDLSIHIIHSRKMNIKAVVTFHASVDELSGIRLPVSLNDENVSVQKKSMHVLSLAIHKKDTFRLKEEITLVSNKPNIEELLWYTTEVRGLDLRPEENVVKVKGELFVFVLYTGDDESGTLQWLEHAVPFNGEVECNGCTPEMIPNMEVSVINRTLEVKPDADGEERQLQADVVLELDMNLYREEDYDVIMDVYTPYRQCVPKCRKEIIESLLVRNFSRCRIADRIEVKETQGKILQICHSQGKIKIDKTKIVKNGIETEGIVRLKVLYIVENDEMPFYSMEAMLPFSYVIEARGITENSIYYLHTDLEQLSTTMLDSNEIEIRATIGLNALVIQCSEEMILEKIEELPLEQEKIRSMPGIIVYVVQQGDTLWNIAKKFYTTVEEIRQMNELEEEELSVGTPLLLVKKVEE
nr:SPOCS domain-containing protein [uncultured Blautia sp.]